MRVTLRELKSNPSRSCLPGCTYFLWNMCSTQLNKMPNLYTYTHSQVHDLKPKVWKLKIIRKTQKIIYQTFIDPHKIPMIDPQAHEEIGAFNMNKPGACMVGTHPFLVPPNSKEELTPEKSFKFRRKQNSPTCSCSPKRLRFSPLMLPLVSVAWVVSA